MSTFLDLSGKKLTLDDLGQVMEEVLDVSAQWYHLGVQLKVRIGTLDRIRTQFHDPRDQLLEMLKTWLNTGDNTSWKMLTDTLRSRSVGASQLASVLETKYHLRKYMPESKHQQSVKTKMFAWWGGQSIALSLDKMVGFGRHVIVVDNLESNLMVFLVHHL